MTDMITVKGEVTEDGQLIVELPPDAPRGAVEVTLKKTASTTGLTLEEEAALDAEFEALLDDPATFTGLGLSAEDIARSPEIGIWKEREDMIDPVAYVAELRRKSRERRLTRED
jgi:hypothetical protein